MTLARAIRWTDRASTELDAINGSDAYFDTIVATVELVARIPTAGQSVADRPDVYRKRAGKHWIYYRDEGAELVVLRLTHTAREREHL